MMPPNVSTFFSLVRSEIAEWRAAGGWAVAFLPPSILRRVLNRIAK